MSYQEKTILVVGGAGFIGSHLTDRLLKQGYSVVIVDDFSTGSKANVNSLAKLYEIPVEEEDLKKVFRREKIDTIYYCAGGISPRDIETDQQIYYKKQVKGFLNLIKNAVEFNVRKVVLCSTLQVYGEETGRITEETLVNPQTYNGALYAALENILKVSANKNRFMYSILRCSSVYGKRQTDHGEGGVIQKYIWTLKRGSVPVIVGDEEEYRDYIFVGDVINACLKVLEGGHNNTYNIASGDPKTIGKVVDTMIKKINPKVKYMVEQGVSQEIVYSNVSIDKAIKQLDWRPVCSIELGLGVMINDKI